MTQGSPSQGAEKPLGSPREVALSSLGHSREYLQNVRRAIERVADLLQRSRLEEANELYAQSLDALNVLIIALTAAAAQLGPAGAPLLGFERACALWVGTLADAQTRQDWTALADCLAYEVSPGLLGWDAGIAAVQEAATA